MNIIARLLLAESFGDERENLAGARVAPELGFLEHRLAVQRDFKTPAARRHDLDVGTRKLFTKRGRQTGSPRFVVSNDAEFDRKSHGRKILRG